MSMSKEEAMGHLRENVVSWKNQVWVLVTIGLLTKLIDVPYAWEFWFAFTAWIAGMREISKWKTGKP